MMDSLRNKCAIKLGKSNKTFISKPKKLKFGYDTLKTGWNVLFCKCTLLKSKNSKFIVQQQVRG